MTLDQVPFALVFDGGRRAITWDVQHGWRVRPACPEDVTRLANLFAIALRMALDLDSEGD